MKGGRGSGGKEGVGEGRRGKGVRDEGVEGGDYTYNSTPSLRYVNTKTPRCKRPSFLQTVASSNKPRGRNTQPRLL